ncbi:hypothetical protein DICPUDRAFT_77614 [Dictyostelium purpureum]|uniref:Uncharacterized protein n=1 Tax=Dictyostelium purpureum TaxID=5786 RepID=F0ZH54_DICPU|nr:uncharacterized protein DICPUDRAFT_77614 [Dictyostelium purpureum]EGC36735.1 hypothetical protein DICPUDRAFT_77614 [Dictyostelium purpureum]|eukprot:XP_003286760.1 hypothetical protein DICPUDRAFT_77614 [Dictyostelium purpureum]
MSNSNNNINNDSKEVLHNYVSNKLTNQPFSCQWIPSSCSIVTVGKKASGGNVKGEFKIHQLDFDSNETPKLSLIYENEFSNPFRCLSFFNGGNDNSNRNFAAGHFNGFLTVWDSDICDLPKLTIKTTHLDGIVSIDTFSDNLVVCGGKDGSVSVWDIRSPLKSINTFTQDDKSNCWSICTNDSTLITGFENGNLNIYDLKTQSKRQSSSINGGICSISSKNKINILDEFIITTNKSFISIVNNNNNNNNNTLNFNNIEIKNNQTIWSCSYSPFNNKDESIFSIAQGDGVVSMYKDQGVLVDKVQISDSPIISLDYNKDKRGLMCSLSLKKQVSILICPL